MVLSFPGAVTLKTLNPWSVLCCVQTAFTEFAHTGYHSRCWEGKLGIHLEAESLNVSIYRIFQWTFLEYVKSEDVQCAFRSGVSKTFCYTKISTDFPLIGRSFQSPQTAILKESPILSFTFPIITVTMKEDQSQWNWYKWVELSGG